jgi:hypothetical protein
MIANGAAPVNVVRVDVAEERLVDDVEAREAEDESVTRVISAS